MSRNRTDWPYPLPGWKRERQAHDWPYPFVRFFARILAAQLACPRCGTILSFGKSGLKTTGEWDQYASALTCSDCALTWQLGILAWRVTSGPRRQPADIRPTVAEAWQMRTHLCGAVAESARKPTDDPVNRFVAEECCCDPLPWRAECPVHGSERA